MGLIGAAFGVGFVIGPAIGAVSSRLGDAGPGLVAAAIAAGNLLLVLLALPEPRRRTARPSALPLRELSGRHLVAPFAAAFCSTLAFTVIYVVFPLHAEWALGLDRSRVGWLFALVGLVAAVVQGLVVGRLAQRAGEGRVVQLGGLGMAAGLVLLPLVATEGAAFLPPGFLIALALTGAGVGLTSPAEAGYVSRATGPAEQGRALGLLQSVNAVARITGPVLAGVVMEWRGATAAFGTAAGVAVVAAAAGRGMRRRTSDEG
jgi:MFS family permease